MSGTENRNGLLWAYELDGKGSGVSILSSLPAVLTHTSTGNAFQWVHAESDNAQAAKWMQSVGLENSVIDALTAPETRPRTAMLEGGVLIVLRGVNTNPGAAPEDMVSVRIWIKGGLIVSARKRKRKLLSVMDVRDSIERGNGPRSPGDFLAKLVERLADRIGDAVDAIDEELTGFELGIPGKRIVDMRQMLSISRRRTAAIRRHLAPQREAVDALSRLRETLSDEVIYSIREQSERTIRYVEDLDLARERALVLHEELQNRIAEEQNARIYLLSIVAAIFLPLSFLTGVFGMNVAGLPGTESSGAFLYLSVAMGLVAGAMIAFMRWRRWL